jgi:hypothetical protein
LHTPTSDADMIAIVAMPTEKMLSFEQPKLVIKNQEGFEPDFTIHESKFHIVFHLILNLFF